MENIEKSELVIANILRLLMEFGLSEAILNFEELGLSDDYGPFFVTCVKWLEAEGLIRTQEIHQLLSGTGFVVGPTLTSKGFAILGHKFSIDGQEVTTAQVVKGKSEGSSNFSAIGDFLGSVLGGAYKSLGS